MRTGTARAIVVAIGLWTGLAGLARVAHAARIVDVRVGGHAGYDRLVIELDGEFHAFHQPLRSGERFVLELDAVPPQPILVLNTQLRRMGRVTIEGVSDGSLLSVQARKRQVRAFTLSKPPRIVIDFSDPADAPLPVPEGAEPMIEAIAPPWGAEPGPEPEAAAEPEPEPDEEPLIEAAVEPPVPVPTPEPRQEPAQVEPAEPPQPEPLSEPQQVELLPEPESLAPLPGPEPVPPPLPTPQVGPAPTAAPATGLDRRMLALGLGAVVLAGGLTLLVLRRARSARAPAIASGEAVPPDQITLEELGRGAEDRLVALESRLDEEVRSRSRVEERLLGLHEDLKVVRDRLHRMSRREKDE